MYVEAGGTRTEGNMFQILSSAMIETEGNLMKKIAGWKMVFTAL